jgi:hypothetical protein
MPERWRRRLGALDGVEPDTSGLRDRALHGPRLPDPASGPARPVIAGVVATALAVGSFALLRTTFGGERGASDVRTTSPPPPTETVPDPAAVCDVPTYDGGVALLGDDFSSVFGPIGPREIPLRRLEAAGEPASSIDGPAADALRTYLSDPGSGNAPPDGWRAIVETDDEVIFAAPPDGGYSDWWVTRFTMSPDGWVPSETEFVDQHQTPAQLGRQLRLGWNGEVVFDDGRWATTLTITNDRDEPWSLGEDGYEPWGRAHVFDPGSGVEIGHVARTVGSWGAGLHVPPGGTEALPISLGGALLDLAADQTYEVIACVPELGLASPVGTLRVEENTVVRTARVLTYPHTGVSMQALGGGRLVLHNGCLAVADGADDRRPTYVLWPDGYALVDRGEPEPVLIDAVGREIARLGDEVSLGGRYVPTENADSATIGGLPDRCRAGGEGYFLTGGVEG